MEVGFGSTLGELVSPGTRDPCAIRTTTECTVYIKHGKRTAVLVLCYPALGWDKESYGVCGTMVYGSAGETHAWAVVNGPLKSLTHTDTLSFTNIDKVIHFGQQFQILPQS